MTNLATLIGTKNLEKLISDEQNTFVVLWNGEYSLAKNATWVDYSKVVGIGSFEQCTSLVKYFNLAQLANF